MAIGRRYRSFFWPAVLILIGVFALLVELNVISADRLYRLEDLWPLILIVIGLELLARRALHGVAVDVAAALILLIAAGGAVAYVSVGPSIPGGTHLFDMSGEIGDLTSATLRVDLGAATVTVHSNSSLGSDLYRARVEYTGTKPSVTLDKATGDLHVSQDARFVIFGNRRVVLDLQLNPSVKWSFSINSGAADGTLDLRGITVGAIEFNAGASRANITLGQPTGIVPITFNGGATTVTVHRPPGTEASVEVSGGAVSLTADGHHAAGIGTRSWQTGGYDTATDAYRIEVNAGAGTVSVDTSARAA
jgi:hypothetical protein